jgi:hypothetical protein
MECRSATSVALVALVVSVLALLYQLLCAARPRTPKRKRPVEGRTGISSASSTSSADVGPYFTRGVLPYTQVGMLEGAKEPIPLYGRPTRSGGERWNYYAMTTTVAPHMLPVSVGGRECARPLGCAELSDGDAADVRGYGAARVALYTRDPFGVLGTHLGQDQCKLV